ncbi:MAG: hypothetical protein Q8R18_06480 [bacterium]|nr:hypothetical protein [bacterium]
MKCVKVLKKDAEKIKKQLLEKGAFAVGYSPLPGREYIYFPVNKEVKGYTLVEKNAPLKEKKEEYSGAYDQIGDIIIVGKEVKDSEAKKLLQKVDVKVVLRREGLYHGEFRTQDLEWIAGEKRKETVYRESGIQMKLDVEKCYFTPRLGTERLRIAQMIQPGEKVLILFSGVGPYPLIFARYSKASLIVGVEKNPVAHQYAVENCKKYPQIQLYNIDAKDFSSSEKFDRVLMPLPKSAEEFLHVAVKYLKKKGTIHFYTFAAAEEIPTKPLSLIKEKIPSFKVLSVVKCGQYAPKKFRVCIDFIV